MKKTFKICALFLIVFLSGCSLCLAMGVIGAIGGLAYAVGNSYAPVVFVADAYGAVVVKAQADGLKEGALSFKDAVSQKDVTGSDPVGRYNGDLTLTTTDGGSNYTMNGTLKLSGINEDLKTAFTTIKDLKEPVDVIFENVVIIGDKENQFFTGLTGGTIYVGSTQTSWKVDLTGTGKAVGFFDESGQNINTFIEEKF